MRKSHTLWLKLALAVLIFVAAPTAYAQYPGYVTNSNDTGLPSYGSFISSSVDTVNLGTGGVSIRIPIMSNTGRGSTYSFFMQYESKFWSLIPTVYPSVGNGPFVYYNWTPDQTALWQVKDTHSVGYVGWTETTYSCAMPPQGGGPGAEIVYEYGPATVLIRSNYIYVAPDGSKHQLPLRNNFPMNFPGYCPDLTTGELPTNLVAQTDNDQVKVDITNDQVSNHNGIVITLANGTHSSTTVAGQEIDSNGNICCIAGRPTYSGDPATTTNHQVYDVVDSNGVTQKVIVDSINISVSTAFPTTTGDAWHFFGQYSGQIYSVVSKITLANGLAYTFSYDPTFGEITQINLPTGGYVKYQWTTLPLADQGPNDPLSTFGSQTQMDARRISQRIVSEDGTTGSEKVWNYSYPAQGTKVTDPLGNSEQHAMGTCGVAGFIDPVPQPSIDLGVSYYDPSGKLLKAVVNNWACDKGALYIAYPTKNLPFTYSVLTEGLRNSRQTGTVTTLGDTNQVSATQSDFNDCYGYTILTQSYTDCRPNPTETREYDYGTGAQGTLLRTTDFTYLHNPALNNASNNYLNAHIWDRVSVKSVYAGSSSGGTLAAQTQYGYDSTTITSVTGASNHDDTDYPYTNILRGNVTTVGRLLTSSSTLLTTTNYYNSVGNLVQTTDPGGHSYYLSYADNYSDSSKNGNSQAFLTSVTSPTTSNGVVHLEGKQYFWYTGLTAAVCGQNAPSPSTCSNTQGLPASDYASYTYDLMGRPATVTHGDGGVTNFTFQESSFPFSVSSSSAIDSAQNLVNTALIDGLGRVTQTQLNSDPDGVDYVDTTYDPAGQKSTVSNPHRSGSSTTDGITTYQYDPLGRTNLVIPPDGTTTSNNVQTFYRGNSVTVADQAGKARRSVTDALGRLIEVDEPAAGSALPGLAATGSTGSVTIQGSEQGSSQYVDTGNQQCTLVDCGGNCIQWQEIYQWQTSYDSGTVSLTANGNTDSVSYGAASTPATIASALAAAITADPSSAVTGVATGATIALSSRATGLASQLSATVSVVSDQPGSFPVSFDSFPRNLTLVGGANAIPSFPPGETVSAAPYVTLYTYNALDDLTCVEQHGTATGQTGCSSAPSNDSSSAWRIRRFQYDSLGRLTTANNPESGAISYTYDADGNVLTKYDARGITTTMTYDQLHRVLTKTYSDGTPTATYTYDVAATDGPGSSANPIGRLVEVKNSNAKEVDSYDSRGRINAQWQCTPLNCGSSWFNLTYGYNYAGGLISESTPMGFTLTPAYDPAARLKSLTSSWSDAQHPANLLTVDPTAGYTPAGALAKMTYGNGLIELSAYNNRLQPTQLRTYNPTTSTDVLNLNYGFTNSAGANDGNVVTFNSTATQIFMRTYTYDELNRLSTMSSPADASGCYGLSWTYDAWGNRLSQNNGGGACVGASHGALANNRVTDTGFTHDSSGNMTADNIHTYTYNAESELTQVNSGSTATYAYDAGGQRARKIASGVTTDYVRDLSGNVVAEIQGSTWTTGYIYSGSQLVAQYNGVPGASGGTTLFSHSDHLGSTRALTTVAAGVSDSMDYLPYGELLSGGGATTHKFTGKERDAESGLDNFEARYYSSNLGRFVSADWSATPEPVPYADFGDPQSLNLYTYVRNVPTVRVDADGHCSGFVACVYQLQNLMSRAADATDNVIGAGKQVVNTALGRDVLKPSNPAQQAGAQAEYDASMMLGKATTVLAVAGVVADVPGGGLSNDAVVVRGGTNTPESFTKGSGVTTDTNGNLQGVSVNSAPGKTAAELSQGLPHGQVGTTTVGEVRAAGGEVRPSPTANNPNHCTMCGVTAEKASSLMKVEPNPAKVPKDPPSE